jgi:hypothetical protein
VRDHPDGDAYWQVADEQGQPLDRHHVVCWWEADFARKKAGLPEPSGWREQGLRPAQPALRMGTAMVEATLERSGPETQLPERQVAAAISARLRLPVWYRNARGQPTLIGGGAEASAGSLVLVPAEPAGPTK